MKNCPHCGEAITGIELRDKENDLAKLSTAFLNNLRFDDSCEYGFMGLDCKRPFGNSDVVNDILEIIEWEPEGGGYTSEQEDYANTLFQEDLIPWMQLNLTFPVENNK